MTREEVIAELKRDIELDNDFTEDYLNAINMAIEALEQEECEDCISRQAALDTFCLSEKSRKYGGDHSGYDTIMLYEVQDALEALPSVNPQKIGHWKPFYRISGRNIYYCTSCEYATILETVFKYCPNCGAKMVEPQESEVKE